MRREVLEAGSDIRGKTRKRGDTDGERHGKKAKTTKEGLEENINEWKKITKREGENGRR